MIRELKSSRKLLGRYDPLQNGVGHALAAPAGERKRIHQNGADLLVKFLTHEPPRTMQPRFHSLRLKTEKLRGFLDAHPFDHACHEHNSKDLGQLVGRSLDKL